MTATLFIQLTNQSGVSAESGLRPHSGKGTVMAAVVEQKQIVKGGSFGGIALFRDFDYDDARRNYLKDLRKRVVKRVNYVLALLGRGRRNCRRRRGLRGCSRDWHYSCGDKRS